MEETANSPLPQGASRIFTKLSSQTLPPVGSQAAQKQADAHLAAAASFLSPARPAGYSWLGLGSGNRPPSPDSPSGRRPSPPGSLFTSGSRGPTLKCFPTVAREARPTHTRFQAVQMPSLLED